MKSFLISTSCCKTQNERNRAVRAVGITIANISVLKNGKAKALKISTLTKLCAALDCSREIFSNTEKAPIKQAEILQNQCELPQKNRLLSFYALSLGAAEKFTAALPFRTSSPSDCCFAVGKHNVLQHQVIALQLLCYLVFVNTRRGTDFCTEFRRPE